MACPFSMRGRIDWSGCTATLGRRKFLEISGGAKTEGRAAKGGGATDRAAVFRVSLGTPQRSEDFPGRFSEARFAKR